MNKTLTTEEISAKAEELRAIYNCKIHPLVFLIEETGEQVTGFMREPERFVKLRVLDQSLSKPMTASAEVLDAVLIKEHTDPRIYSENPEYDDLYLGATLAAQAMITFKANQFKKK